MVLVLLVAAATFAPLTVEANLVCPGCEVDNANRLSPSGLIELVLTAVLRRGVAVLVAGAAFVVGLPWAIAGIAVAAVGNANSHSGRGARRLD